jgi:hypothetical protein
MLQKSVIKCQSTFERIKEAWADIRGFEYRPSPMNEAFAYSIQNNEQKKEKNKKNKTQKNNNNNDNNNNNKTLRKYPNDKNK